MRTYLKAFILLFFVYSCSPEEIEIPKTLTTLVQPASSGTVARITQRDNNYVQIIAVPAEFYVFKYWSIENETKTFEENSISIIMDADKVVTAVFELKDSDNDGVTDDLDACPDTVLGEIVDENGCALSQKDTDEDGVTDDLDVCPDTPSYEIADENGCSDSQYTYVPDDNFEQYLIDQGWDDELDDYVITNKIKNITDLYVSYRNISDLTGIEDFESLTYLDVSNNKLISLDVNGLTSLQDVYAERNQLAIVNFSGATTLRYVKINDNELTNLDVSTNTNLDNLQAQRNQLTSIDVSGATALQNLHISQNQLSSLDVSGLISLRYVYADYNQLTSIDVSGATALKICF